MGAETAAVRARRPPNFPTRRTSPPWPACPRWDRIDCSRLFRGYGAQRRVAAGAKRQDPGAGGAGRSAGQGSALAGQALGQRDRRRSMSPALGGPSSTAGVTGVALGSPAYPSALLEDPEPPAIVFIRGNPEVLEGPKVAVVGTRNCTRIGREVATELGAVSLRRVCGWFPDWPWASTVRRTSERSQRSPRIRRRGPPVAVVAGGLDVVYPRRHADLHRDVRGGGRPRRGSAARHSSGGVAVPGARTGSSPGCPLRSSSSSPG